MTGEMVCSAVIGETVNRIISSLVGKLDQEKPDELSCRDSIERMETAHIRMEATLAMSSKWQIIDMPMLRWRRKLKRAAQDCDDALRRSKQRVMEDNRTKQLRFERFADGANEFLKLVEFGGTPHHYMFFDPLIGNLLSGKAVTYKAMKGNMLYYLTITPMSFEERGVEAKVGFACQDSKAPTKLGALGFMLRLSESTDVFGVIIKCLQSCSCIPQFKIAAEHVKRELVQLPTQDFSWVTHPPYSQSEYWINVHSALIQWYRPNPLCCSDHEHHQITSPSNTNASSSSSSSSLSRFSSMFPEQVMMLLLQCHVSLSDGQDNSDIPPLKLGALFIPHDSPEDMEPAAESYALEVIGENEQEVVHPNACLQGIDDKLLPKALQYLHQNNGSRMHRMCFKSNHGTAHLCVEKVNTEIRQGDSCNTEERKPVYIDLLK